MAAPDEDCHDCASCHFEWEERVVLPYLSPFWQRWLLAEHKRIREAGYPPREVLRHARQEIPIFYRYCPRHIVQQAIADHNKLEPELIAQLG